MRNRWRPLVSVLLLVVATIGGLVVVRASSVEPNRTVVFPGLERPLVIAHRGGRDLWPENTLWAFERAWAAGVDVLELDVHLCADGHLVVIHDETVDRTTDGSGNVVEMTLADLRALDAAARYRPPEGGPPPPAGSVRIPTLDEVLDTFPGAPFVIEVKPATSEAARALGRSIRDREALDRIVVGSAHEIVHETLAAEFPDVLTSSSPNEIRTMVVLSRLRLGFLHRPRSEVFQIPLEHRGTRVYGADFLAGAARSGQEVQIWTVDDPETMRRLVDDGVGGIMTDRPDLLLDVVPRPRRDRT